MYTNRLSYAISARKCQSYEVFKIEDKNRSFISSCQVSSIQTPDISILSTRLYLVSQIALCGHTP